ncbi:MAG: SGNH/GDSL hydrolase family protein [Myxococcales bacterium]|nr:SGNH/GDSL hydrolase family protein [Myxococcales bacterium]MCB9533508.1 SGNH/GDSL hydrolase family protein [Myxococcales bacterium]
MTTATQQTHVRAVSTRIRVVAACAAIVLLGVARTRFALAVDAALTSVLPVWLGLRVGRVLASRTQLPVAASVAAGIAGWVGVCWLALVLTRAMPLTVIFVGVLGVVATTVALTAGELVPVRKLVVATALTLALSELLGRLVLPPDPYMLGGYGGPVQTDELLDRRCVMLDPGRWTRPQSSGPRVFYVGDSMVEGMLPPGQRNFVQVLRELAPDAEHVNAGISGAATDSELLLVEQLIATGHPTHIVLFVYANDLQEVGDPYVCCGDRPLYALDGGDLVSNCPDGPRWSASVGARLRRSQLPPLMLAAMPFSEVCRHVTWGIAGALSHVGAKPSTDRASDLMEAALRGIARSCDAAGVQLAVVMAPDRRVVEGHVSYAAELGSQMFEIIQRAVPEALDATPAAERWVSDSLPSLWATHMGPGDGHFGAGGHDAFARWLAGELRDRWPEVYGSRDVAPGEASSSEGQNLPPDGVAR